ncbi:MAG TPA: hypothetical protein VFG51_02980 [Candidatus Saccharimonadia bacterium]|nr:hypothetical protein [Candidatus Saccharimonadia bacterium]
MPDLDRFKYLTEMRQSAADESSRAAVAEEIGRSFSLTPDDVLRMTETAEDRDTVLNLLISLAFIYQIHMPGMSPYAAFYINEIHESLAKIEAKFHVQSLRRQVAPLVSADLTKMLEEFKRTPEKKLPAKSAIIEHTEEALTLHRALMGQHLITQYSKVRAK